MEGNWMSLVSFFLLTSCCLADYTIRTRQPGDKEVLTQLSPMVVTTLGIPPYSSNFINGSEGLTSDLLKALSRIGGLSSHYQLILVNEPSPGIIGEDQLSGITEDVQLKFTHFAVGPIFQNYFLSPSGVTTYTRPWYYPQVVLVVRADSELVRQANSNEEGSEYILDLSSVDFIMVEKSSEFNLLTDFRVFVPPGLVEVQEQLKRRSPSMVSDICEGLKQLGVPDDKVKASKSTTVKASSSRTKALILNSLEASHYASGNDLVSILYPSKPVQHVTPSLGFAFLSNNLFMEMNERVSDAISKLESHKRLEGIVNKWTQYDKNACTKLKLALSSSSNEITPLSSINLSLVLFLILVKLNTLYQV